MRQAIDALTVLTAERTCDFKLGGCGMRQFARANLIFAAFMSLAGHAAAQKFRRSEDPVPGQYVIRLSQPAVDTFDEHEKALGIGDAIVRAQFGTRVHFYRNVFLGLAATLSEPAARAISADPRVDHVSEVSNFTLASIESAPSWGLDRIDQRPATRDGLYSYVEGRFQVHVYIIDAGIRTSHQDFVISDFENARSERKLLHGLVAILQLSKWLLRQLSLQ